MYFRVWDNCIRQCTKLFSAFRSCSQPLDVCYLLPLVPEDVFMQYGGGGGVLIFNCTNFRAEKGSIILGYFRKCGSASYIVREVREVRERERERERERDGSDVTIVALKLAMSLHFPLPKIRTIAMSSHFPLPKFAIFVSPFTLPVSPFLNGHHCGAEILLIEKMNQINTKNYWK